MFEIRDDFTGFIFFMFCGLYDLPSSFILPPQNRDCVWVFLSLRQCCLESAGVALDRIVELLAALYKTFLRLIGRLKSAEKFLVLVLEAQHRTLADHTLERGLEILL